MALPTYNDGRNIKVLGISSLRLNTACFGFSTKKYSLAKKCCEFINLKIKQGVEFQERGGSLCLLR